MSLDVFISYSSKDKLTADAVCGTLEARGIRCWIAPRDIMPGQDWSDAIIDGLTAARVFVLLLSSSSNVSEQVKREVQNAVAEGLPIVPFRLEDVALSKHMRYFIGTPHWLDALSPPMEAHLERLAKTVHALLQATDHDERDSILLLEEGLGEPKISPLPENQHPWNPETLRRLERELSLYLGSMARVVVHQSALKTFDIAELCELTSRAIAKADHRATFIETTARLFGSPAPKSVITDSAPLPSLAPPAPVSPAPAPVLEPAPAAEAEWDETALKNIERQFAIHMGPLAKLLVKRASKKTSDVNQLYFLLAENLPTPQERDEFLKEKRA